MYSYVAENPYVFSCNFNPEDERGEIIDYTEFVIYPIRRKNNQVIFSKDGILYLRKDDLVLYKSQERIETLGYKSKKSSKNMIPHVFRLDKIYILFEEECTIKFISFHKTADNYIIYTERLVNDFIGDECEPLLMNWNELQTFLYDVSDNYILNEKEVTGKYIFTNKIKYVKSVRSATSFKQPDFIRSVIENNNQDEDACMNVLDDTEKNAEESEEMEKSYSTSEAAENESDTTYTLTSLLHPTHLIEVSNEGIDVFYLSIEQIEADSFEVSFISTKIIPDFGGKEFLSSFYLKENKDETVRRLKNLYRIV